jgi:hypothetical protein
MVARFAVRVSYGIAVAVWVLAVLVVTSRPAYGYVDPGSGLFAFQVLGSTVVGFTFLVRNRVRQFFARLTRRNGEVEDNAGTR